MEDDVKPTPEDQLADAGVATTIPAMTAVLQDRQMDPVLRAASAMALARTGDHSVLPVLLATLDDPDDGHALGSAQCSRPAARSSGRAETQGHPR
jgi:HEAT repeat protein